MRVPLGGARFDTRLAPPVRRRPLYDSERKLGLSAASYPGWAPPLVVLSPACAPHTLAGGVALSRTRIRAPQRRGRWRLDFRTRGIRTRGPATGARLGSAEGRPGGLPASAPTVDRRRSGGARTADRRARTPWPWSRRPRCGPDRGGPRARPERRGTWCL